jgi:transposase
LASQEHLLPPGQRPASEPPAFPGSFRIDTLSALGLAAEIGDFSRFKSAEELMAFVGLVPSEHSSRERRRQGAITKVGNSHVRRLLVEAAWHARRRPKVGYELARRQRGQDAVVHGLS